ncbi:MAG TPA: asparagine synthase-related protein [Thermoplasmata archaeon]|nr:asparagine synthase-related protein [Thermoplasmata archaeon]
MAAGRRASSAPGEEGLYLELDRAFAPALQAIAEPAAPLCLLFSGGVDSGLLAWELRSRRDVQLLTVGARGATDFAAAAEAARTLGLPWTPEEVDERAARDVLATVPPEVRRLPLTPRTVLVALAIALSRTPPSHVLCGQGPDELFLGYAHFQGLSVDGARRRVQYDLRAALDRDWPLTQEIASGRGRRISAPYLNERFVAAAEAIPLERRRPDPEPKGLFRRWARHRGLPESIARRPKRALQFGSGLARLLRSIGEG